jgi:2-C-methyl-D-erythritol 4-phosphate cytidylyltransferase
MPAHPSASLARNKAGSAFSTQPVEETINLSSTKPQQSGRVRRSQFTTLYTLQCIETRKLAVAHRQHRHRRASSSLKDEHGSSAPPMTPYVSFLSSRGVPFLSGTYNPSIR